MARKVPEGGTLRKFSTYMHLTEEIPEAQRQLDIQKELTAKAKERSECLAWNLGRCRRLKIFQKVCLKIYFYLNLSLNICFK